MAKTIRYRCFAETNLGSVDLGVVNAVDDKDAIKQATRLSPGSFGAGPKDTTQCVACIWERDPLFYTATDIRDLEE